MLAPLGVLREPHIGSGRKPGPGQRLGVLDKQVGRRPAVRSRTEVRLHAEMNLCAIEGDEAVAAAVPLAGTETEPAIVGKGSGQVANGEDRCYSRTHDCNLSRPARAVQTAHVLDEMRVRPLTGGMPPGATEGPLRLLEGVPDPTGDQRWDALFARLAKHLAIRDGKAAPGWSASRGLRCLWFPFDTPGARMQALVHAPAAFGRWGVSSLTMR